ncbi:hypothetical protein N0V83_003275 [Neocucurbitaria cava]|uniref:Uncharacterized protein n=1 Tax=Neocucurbitaria cava TaxID=798079 RepID=A0A9W8YBD4_9PLEO|nr:hypothetical protein N0V83_003275 [Neocucurbitaria cava]
MSLFRPPGYYSPQPAWREHICGLYYSIPYNGLLQKTYLPQVELQAHAAILATTSRTTLTQTFVNPSGEKGIREVRYTFPLYDGVSVVGFTCHVGDRTIVGEVKEKEKARAVFQEAVARGETAGLLEQLPDAADVFTTTVGNIPPGARVIIKITYLGELKHDMEVDGIRFTIPNIICPRYGNYPGSLRTTPAIDAMGSGISITVDAQMAEGSFIQKMQSPTHPISMTMGTISFAPNAEPTMTKASATLALGTAQLDTDFVLQIIAKDTGVPRAVLENHPTIPNHRALMATLVPKFVLPAEKPEIVFVCDRSGSMGGTRINLVIQSLKVFLKSLPVGVKFNICSFGSSHSFLWPNSVTYSQQTLDEAVRHADTFSANYGGTEMLDPLKSTIETRYKDMPLEVILLTDGEIWNQQVLFSYLNESITETKAPIRIFTLGIGNGVSHSLIEGVAKAGNGFSQTVGEGEKMDSKVVRMLKGALSPHINDYTLDVKYSNGTPTDAEDEFEIVEKVADSLKVKLDLQEQKGKNETVSFQSEMMRTFFADYNQKKPISLFDTSADPDKEEPPAYDGTGEARYAHLPKMPIPRVLQAPQNIPSLFAFNRTTSYLLLGSNAPQARPKSIILRGTSKHGPLELEIPIQTLEVPGATIHQLAAKKAISELEQGRGWLSEAKDESGTLIKTKCEGRFHDMVEREAVRLGVQFQVGGKWCSFVAVESNTKKADGKEKEAEGWQWLEDEGTERSTQAEGSTSPYDSESSVNDDIDANIGFMLDDSTARKRLEALGKAMGGEVKDQNHNIMRILNNTANHQTSEGLDVSSIASTEAWRNRQTTAQSISKKVKLSQSPSSQPQSAFGNLAQSLKSNINKVTTKSERLDTSKSAAPMMFNQASYAAKPQSSGLFGGLFGSKPPPPPAAPSGRSSTFTTQSSGGSLFGGGTSSRGSGGSLFGSSNSPSLTQPPPPPPPGQGVPTALAAPTMSGAFGGMNQMKFPPPPPAPGQPPQSNSALSDYQMQLMLVEQQNKKRLLMARQEADNSQQQQQQVHPALGASRHIPATRHSFQGWDQMPAPVSGSFMSFGEDTDALENFDFDSFLHSDGTYDMMDCREAGETTTAAAPPPPPPPAFAGGSDSPAYGTASLPAAPASLFGSTAPLPAVFTPLFGSAAPPPAPPAPTTPQTPESLLHHLISLQTFEGSWTYTTSLLSSLQSTSFITLDNTLLQDELSSGLNPVVLATAIVVVVFEEKLGEFRGSWELVVEKAREWLSGEVEGRGGSGNVGLEELFERVMKVVV